MKQKSLLKTLLLLCALVVGGSAWAEDVTTTCTFSSKAWTADNGGTWESGKDGNQFTQGRGIQVPTGATGANGTSGTSFENVSKVVVTYSTNASSGAGSIAIKVGSGTAKSQNVTKTGGTTDRTLEYAFSPVESGKVNIAVTCTTNSIYVKSIAITCSTGGGDTPTTYTVTYDANGGSGTMTDENSPYNAGATVTVLGNGFTRDGHTFTEWNTAADGNGTAYDADDTFTISANTTLYAQWTVNTYNVTLPTADNYGSYTMDKTNPVAYGTKVTLTYTPATGYENYQATWSVNGEAINGNTFTMPDEAVTVTVSVAEVVDYVILPFNWAGGPKNDLTAVTGVTASGLGSDYAASNAPYRVKFDGNGDYIQFKTDSQPDKVTIGVKMIGGASTSKITVQGSADGNTFTDVEELTISGAANNELTLETTNAFAANVRYVRLLFTKGSNVGVGPISIAVASTDPVINAELTLNLAADATSGAIAYTIDNPVSGTNLIASVESSCDWISNFVVGDENVTFNTTANTSAERSAVITLSYGTVSKEVTVTQAAHVTTATYTLATEVVSGRHYIIVGSIEDSSKAMGAQGTNNRNAVEIVINDGTTSVFSDAGVYEFVIYGPDADGRYSIYDEVNSGYLYAASSGSNHLKTQASNNINGKWRITFSNGAASIIADGSGNRNVMQYNSSSSLFSCYASASQSPVYLYEKNGEATPTESRTLNEFGYATYCSQNALDFTDAEGVTAWAITGVNGENITFSQITGKVPAGTGMLLKGAANASVTMTSAAGAVAALNGNLLEGTLAPMTINDNEYFGLSGNTFVPVLAGTVPAGKALLPVSDAPESSRLTFVFEDATGIATVEQSPLNDNRYYNLSGQHVDSPKKGLYIVNGKKVVVK